MTSKLSRGMASDVIAFEQAEDAFHRLHGEEARARWAALGGRDGGTLEALQLEVIERNGTDRAGWKALAWEVERRINLLEDARAALRQSGAAA